MKQQKQKWFYMIEILNIEMRLKHHAINFYCDNRSALHFEYQLMDNKMKHINITYQFLKNRITNKKVDKQLLLMIDHAFINVMLFLKCVHILQFLHKTHK